MSLTSSRSRSILWPHGVVRITSAACVLQQLPSQKSIVSTPPCPAAPREHVEHGVGCDLVEHPAEIQRQLAPVGPRV
eukprot:2682905-Pyramimonas_sp.AAC.1